MRLWSRAIGVTILAATAVVPAAAAQETPAQVATAFFTAMVEERWRDAAQALDLMAFDRYRRERIAAARLPQPPLRPVTVDEYLQHDPGMPRVVAEYHVRKHNEVRYDPNESLLREFAGVRSLDSLALLSTEESAARWLQAQDFRWSIRQAIEQERARGCPISPDRDHSLPVPNYQVLGAVVTDSTTAYVLHQSGEVRRADPDLDAAMYTMSPNILTLRRRRDRWKILPRETMLYGTASFVSSAACEPAGRPRPPR